MENKDHMCLMCTQCLTPYKSMTGLLWCNLLKKETSMLDCCEEYEDILDVMGIESVDKFDDCKECVCRDCESKDYVNAGGCVSCEICEGSAMRTVCESKEYRDDK